MVFAERGDDLALDVFDDVGVVLAFDNHHERDAAFDLGDVGFVDQIGEDRTNVGFTFDFVDDLFDGNADAKLDDVVMPGAEVAAPDSCMSRAQK